MTFPSLAEVRANIVRLALADNGYLNGSGYPGPRNKYNEFCGRGQEFACADGTSTWLAQAGVPFPVIQAIVGFAYVPYGVSLAKRLGAVKSSYEAEPGDPVIFMWSPNSIGDHIGVTVWRHGSGSSMVLRTCEADSGPSNVDGFRGEGGTHVHDWPVPDGQGNDCIMLVIDLAKIYALVYPNGPDSAPVNPIPAAPVPATPIDPWKAVMSSPIPAPLQAALDTITKALAQTNDTATKALKAAKAGGSGFIRVLVAYDEKTVGGPAYPCPGWDSSDKNRKRHPEIYFVDAGNNIVVGVQDNASNAGWDDVYHWDALERIDPTFKRPAFKGPRTDPS